MTSHLYYYAKAYVAALSTGVLYLTTVIGPDITFADLGHVSLLHWIGFAGSILGVGGLTAVVTNGAPPASKETPAPVAPPAAASPAEAPTAPASTFPAAAVAAAEAAPAEVTLLFS